jgi:hypothetical protein
MSGHWRWLQCNDGARFVENSCRVVCHLFNPPFSHHKICVNLDMYIHYADLSLLLLSCWREGKKRRKASEWIYPESAVGWVHYPGSLSPMLSIRNRTRLTPAGRPACIGGPATLQPGSQVQRNQQFNLSFSKEKRLWFVIEHSRMYICRAWDAILVLGLRLLNWPRNKYVRS